MAKRQRRQLPRDTPLLKQARERFKLADEADAEQAQREKEDLAFYAGDQWPADIRLARQGQKPVNGMPAVPSRPTLVINKVREPVRQVQNEIRDSDIGIELTPADDFGDLGVTPDDTEVTLREGLTRRIIRDSNGQDAWNWAGDRADIAGRGYFAVMTRYLPGKTNDQEIYLHRIYNQAGVLGDPSRTEPDGSDADWWFVGKWSMLDRVAADYPKDVDGKTNPFSDMSEQDFTSMAEDYPSWCRIDGTGESKVRSVREVDYWYTERESRELVTLSTGEVVWSDEVPEGAAIVEGSERVVVEPRIKYCKILGGCMEADKTDWLSPDMPIIEILGEELHPYDDQKRAEGMVRNARDSQMAFNYMVSKQVEQIGLSPIPPIMVDPEAIDGYESWYDVANTRTLPRLPYRTYDDQGRQLEKPSRPPVDPGNLQIAQSIALFDQMIKSTTAVPDPTLGNVDPSLKSGRAIKETVLNAKASTSNFVAGRVRAIRRAAHVINGLLYPIYGQRPGRLVRIMTGEGTHEAMLIGDPQQQQQMQQRAAKVGKLTEDAKFNVAVKITKNYDTRRQQENSMLGDLIASSPEMFMPVVGDLYMASSDLPSRKQAAKRFRVMLAPPIQEMLAQEEQGGEPIPPAVQAKMAQLQQQLQHAEAAIKELAEEAHGKRVESQTKIQVEQMSAQKDVAIEQMRLQGEIERLLGEIELQKMKDATTIRVKEIDAQMKGLELQHTLLHESDAMARTQAHEAALEESGRSHDARMAERQQRHDAAMGAAQTGAEADEASESRRFEAGEAEREREAASREAERGRQHEAVLTQAQLEAQASQQGAE